ncbi:isochorismatase family protein [Aquabacter sp. CN5-332]|uniref:isochorismatase family protein n=1 Tax=Aquabacter sp. CN5-332 TaxID=3156608 RepID=UPI0032B5C554
MLHRLASARFGFAVCVGVSLLMGAPAGAASVVDEWTSVKAPPPPEVKPVTADPKTTALLVLDLVRQGCNEQRRPRCLPTVAPVQALLEKARAAGVPVVYSLVANSTAADVLKDVAPLGSEPTVTSGTDKFLGTDLDKILREKGIKTVIVVGTAAHGAVLTTATAAALRGFSVVVPVDGLSSETPYAEQYTVWNLVNAPVIAPRVTLTKTDTITF